PLTSNRTALASNATVKLADTLAPLGSVAVTVTWAVSPNREGKPSVRSVPSRWAVTLPAGASTATVKVSEEAPSSGSSKALDTSSTLEASSLATKTSSRPVVVGAWLPSTPWNRNTPLHTTSEPPGPDTATEQSADAPRSGTVPVSVVAPGKLPTVPGTPTGLSPTTRLRSSSSTPHTVTMALPERPLPETVSTVPGPPLVGDTDVMDTGPWLLQATRSRAAASAAKLRRITARPTG